MYVVASFKLNKNLERTLAELEYIGINRKKILALPLASAIDNNLSDLRRKMLFETPPILITICALFGAIYGFILHWGPVLWGLIGVGIGASFGIAIDLLRTKRIKMKNRNEEERLTEVFLLVHCSSEDQIERVKECVRKWSPLGISTYCNR